MILAALLVATLAIPAVWTWYVSRGELAPTTDAKRWRILRIAVVVAAGAGFAILALGVMAFALTGYDWLVLELAWSVGLLYLGWLTPVFRRVRQGASKTAGTSRYKLPMIARAQAERLPQPTVYRPPLLWIEPDGWPAKT